ncbi:Nn.00g066260.m01.CDS01 [Neocucurbitaria sp. VM-36]
MVFQSRNAVDKSNTVVSYQECAHTPVQVEEKFPILIKDAASEHKVRLTSSSLLGTWWFEIFSYCVAIAVLAAVVAILAVYDGRPNPLWSGGITLNTIISFASMLFRISLLVPVASCVSQLGWVWLAQQQRPLYDVVRFDRASRSPYGSLEFLFSHRIGSFAFVGALVSVLSLVIGPFFQQSVAFYSASVVDATSVSYASFASDYNASVGFVSDLHFDMSLRTPLNMKAAIYNGLYSSSIVSQPNAPFSCPSGNCTWDSFPTLALGVECRDAPEQFRLNCSVSDNDNYFPDRCIITGTGQPANRSRLMIGQTEQIGVNGPNSAVLHFAQAYDTNTFDVDPSLWTIPMGGRADWEWIRGTDLRTKQIDEYSKQSYIAHNSTIESRRCKFYTCLQVIQARVENGVYSETVSREVINATFDDNVTNFGAYTYTYIHENGSSTNITLTKVQQNTLLQDIQIPFEGLERYSADPGVGGRIKYGNVSMERNDQLLGADILQNLYLATNLTDMVYTVARHMNVALRSVQTSIDLQADPKNTTGLPRDYISPKNRVPGLVHINKIHVRVRWGWLALPAFLAILVLTLLVATILVSEKEKVGVWKDSPLPLLLFSRWEGDNKSVVACARTEKEIRYAAEGIRARLVNDTDEGGVHLKGTIVVERGSGGT